MNPDSTISAPALRSQDGRQRDLEAMARRARGHIVEMIHRAKTPHLGSSLSCVDILIALYFGVARVTPETVHDPDRDRVILSKGHAAPGFYAVLAERGYLPVDELATYNADGGRLAEHPPPNSIPGVEAATGSLGHGLPMANGMALAARHQGRDTRQYVVMSDGECNEGSTWEAAMFAGAHRLERLLAIVDFNGWQATGRSTEILHLEPLAAKFEACGWSAREVDGHDLGALIRELERLPDGSGRPVALIARTVKGKGVSFMEDDNNWHYRVPTADEVLAAHGELGLISQ